MDHKNRKEKKLIKMITECHRILEKVEDKVSKRKKKGTKVVID